MATSAGATPSWTKTRIYYKDARLQERTVSLKPMFVRMRASVADASESTVRVSLQPGELVHMIGIQADNVDEGAALVCSGCW